MDDLDWVFDLHFDHGVNPDYTLSRLPADLVVPLLQQIAASGPTEEARWVAARTLCYREHGLAAYFGERPPPPAEDMRRYATHDPRRFHARPRRWE